MKHPITPRNILCLCLCQLWGLCAIAFSDPVAIYRFDPDNTQQIQGTIQTVRQANWYGEDHPNWIAEVVLPSSDIITVDLGPEGMYDQKPAQGNQIKATGSRVVAEHQTLLLSTSVQIEGNAPITIRNDQGIPVWLEKTSIQAQRNKFHRRMNRGKRMRRRH